MVISKLIKCLFLYYSLGCIIVSHANAADSDMKLMFVHALWRHGDRSPTKTWPKDAIKESDWSFGGGGFGQLSPKGMTQHLNLGIKLRSRYINGTFPGYLSATYKSNEIYVRSTDVNRTVISAFSNMIGLYGQSDYGSNTKDDYPDVPGWPKGLVPIAIHTVDDDSDYLANTESTCPLRDKWWDVAKQTDEVSNFSNSPAVVNMLKNLTASTGLDTTIDNLWILTQGLFIEQIYFKEKIMQAYPWFSVDLYNKSDLMNDQVDLYQNGIFSKPNMYKEYDIGMQLKKLRGGSLVNEISSRMQNKIDCLNNADNCINWIKNLKAYFYSAHDTTLYAFFSAIGVEEYAIKIPGSYPQYSACALVELYQDTKTKGYFFKLMYHKDDQSDFDDETAGIPGCEKTHYCPISVFQQIAATVKPDQPMETWCFTDIPHGFVSSPAVMFSLAYAVLSLLLSFNLSF